MKLITGIINTLTVLAIFILLMTFVVASLDTVLGNIMFELKQYYYTMLLSAWWVLIFIVLSTIKNKK